MTFAGIDYGSKMAGTTAIAFVNASEQIEFAQSAKNKDADRFILEWVAAHQPRHIFFDAPLSLPGVYKDKNSYEDYFYRQCDRDVRGMSPMFLGGLTARAMRLQAELSKVNTEVLEVYPSQLADVLQLDRALYKKQKVHLPAILSEIAKTLPYPIQNEQVTSWHQVDALLALLSGYRFTQNQHLTFGDPEEGIIIV